MRLAIIAGLAILAATATAAEVIDARPGIGSVGVIVQTRATTETATVSAVDRAGTLYAAKLIGQHGDKRVFRIDGLGLSPRAVTLMLDDGTTITPVAQVTTDDALAGLTAGDADEGAALAASIGAEFPADKRAAAMTAIRKGVVKYLIYVAKRAALARERDAELKAAQDAAASVELPEQ